MGDHVPGCGDLYLGCPGHILPNPALREDGAAAQAGGDGCYRPHLCMAILVNMPI